MSLQTGDNQHMGMPRGPSGQWFQRAFTSSCILLIDRPPLPRAASHTTSHPTSYAIFATKSALSATAQLASSDSLPILKMISLRCRLETPSPPSFSSFSVNMVPKTHSSSLHSFTKHSASTSSPIVIKALLPTLSLQTPIGGGSSTSAQQPWLSL